MTPHARRSRAGFTLLELVVALVSLSFLAAGAITFYFRAPEVTLENAAILLARDLRTAQNRSAYLGEPAKMRFDEDGYRLVDLRDRVVRHPRTQLPFVRSWSMDGVFEGVRIIDIDFEGDKEVGFDNVGTTQSGGSIQLEYNGQKRTLLIASGSGRVLLPDGSSGWGDEGR